jgi:hypothetical protein
MTTLMTPTAADITKLMESEKIDRTLAALMLWARWRKGMCDELQKDLRNGRDVREVMIEFLQVLRASE